LPSRGRSTGVGIESVSRQPFFRQTFFGDRFMDMQPQLEIIAGVADPSRVGVCRDTGHTVSAGYDLTTPEGYAQTLATFDAVVGFTHLKGLHLNDGKKALGSHVDRHASLGEGTLGLETFRRIMRDPRFDAMPLILETPDETRWAEEIRLLKGMIGG